MNQCRKKLFGIIPALITLEDLRMRVENQEFIEAYCSVVSASLDKFKFDQFNPDTILNANQQVYIFVVEFSYILS